MKYRKIVITVSLLSGITLLCSWDAPGGNGDNVRTDRASLILRNLNTGAITNTSVGWSHSNILMGEGNKAGFTTGSLVSNRTILAGMNNQCAGSNNILIGDDNMVRGSTSTSYAYNSVAIGEFNHVFAPRGWVMGSSSEALANKATAVGVSANASGDSSVAIGLTAEASGTSALSVGVGTKATVGQSTAIGRYNATMTSNTVLDIGSGTSSARFTALRVTNDGGVILGRAQGDISMGDYQ
jgi:hypothetical protein